MPQSGYKKPTVLFGLGHFAVTEFLIRLFDADRNPVAAERLSLKLAATGQDWVAHDVVQACDR